jgi:hypothetical protein
VILFECINCNNNSRIFHNDIWGEETEHFSCWKWSWWSHSTLFIISIRQRMKHEGGGWKDQESVTRGLIRHIHCLWMDLKFAAGDRHLQIESHSGYPFCIDDSPLKVILKSDPHQTTTDLARKLGCHWTTVANHLHAMKMVRKLDWWETKSSVLSWFNEDPFFVRLVTSNEKWILWDN